MLERLHPLDHRGQVAAVNLIVTIGGPPQVQLVRRQAQHVVVEGDLVLQVDLRLPLFDAVQRRLRDVQIAALDDGPHVTEEKRQQQRADVRAVHVGVGHDDDPVVADLLDVEILPANAGAERGDQRLQLLAAQHAVEARLLDVQDFAAQRQDGLEIAVAALLCRAAGGITLHDVELGQRRVALRTISQLAGQRQSFEKPLAPRQVAGLARRFTRPRGVEHLLDDLTAGVGILFQEDGQLLVDDGLHDALDLAVAEFGLGLPLKLGLGHFDAQDTGQTLADVLAGQILFDVLEQVVIAGVGVDGASQGALEADEVGATFYRVDGIDERKDGLVVGVVVLHRHFEAHVVALPGDEDRLRVQHRLVLVEVGDERRDAALVMEVVPAAIALIFDGDAQPAIEEAEFPQASGQDVETEFGGLGKNLGVRLEGHRGADPRRAGALLEWRLRFAAAVPLGVHVALAVDFQLQVLRHGVDHRDADPVQPAGYLVAVLAELRPGVQLGQHDLGGGNALRGMNSHRDAAPIVLHGNRVVGMDKHLDVGAETRHGLVHAVVDDLVHEMVQPLRSRAADVHGGPFAHGFEALEDVNAAGIVAIH